MQTRLDERMIKDCVLFASGHKGEANQVGEDGSGAILSVKPEQGALLWELVRSLIATDGRECLAQFRSVEPVVRGAPNEPSHWKV
jgi:hypothetical protein